MTPPKPLTPPIAPPAPQPGLQIDRDPLKLHPIMRNAMEEVLRECEAEALPFKVFEAYRYPQRQSRLYQQGRGTPGPVVTRAKPWESYHQYGLACDFVLFINGGWSWDAAGAFAQHWTRLTEIGQMYGLEGLSFEKPHLQVAGLELSQLQAGSYPGGGDATWEDNLREALQNFPMINPTT